ncbi:MAG TPA: 3-deoxy-7-phosphoheptulonate synthase class II [Bryobacteraceae bacterium]|nr:3-deoxy-7-phosphoheptulonate synthase class II [Bryobacteraceae bacterium]
MNDWSPDSWKTKQAAQAVAYSCQEEVDRVVEQIAKLPPLVTSWEVLGLKAQLAEAARGERFLLQGGDCAESFDTCDSATIANKIKVLLQMSLVLVHGAQKRIVRVGRFAGQYAKPRTEEFETRNGVTLPSYRGDLINGAEFTPEARRPDPQLMLRGYERAAMTINFIRALVVGGFVNPHHLDYWNLDWVTDSPMAEEYRRMARSISDSLRFMESLSGAHPGDLHVIDFFTSHEGLHLPYEQAQTRQVPRQAGWFDLSTHFPWIGMRTANPDGAHVEYFRGIRNPIGLKVGPGMSPQCLRKLIELLNPENEPGRLTLIHRLGSERIAELLPPLIEAVRGTGSHVLWCCDPMHGNTRITNGGVKTRYFEEILNELNQAFEIHKANGGRLGGMHVELTGEAVTECVGGARAIGEGDLNRAYRTYLDPRLNYEQALELALFAARKMRELNGHATADSDRGALQPPKASSSIDATAKTRSSR